MLFRHLSISGLGPFGGSHDIDFDALTSDGLFLLEGPTGSGKSSLIDAIVFALYAAVAGKDSDESRIRSTHADPMTASRVRLVFTVESGTYTVIRTPRWERPKTRGTGSTVVNATATLIRLSEQAVEAEDWENGQEIASGPRDVGIELSSILQLTREQFIQTVVLPQGQFATFLRLKSDERSAVLETLFATGDYRTFTETLRVEASQAQKAVSAARIGLDQALGIWLSNDGVIPWSEQVTELRERILDETDRDILTVLSEASKALTKEADERVAGAAELQALETQANAELDSARAINKAIADRATLLTRLAMLDEDAERITALREQIEFHERASYPARIYQQTQNAISALEKLLANAPTGIREIAEETADSIEYPHALKSVISEVIGALEARLSDLDMQAGRLAPLAVVEAELPQRRQEHEDANKELLRRQKQVAELAAAISEFPAKHESLSAELKGAQTTASEVGAIEAQLAALAATERLLREFEEAEKKLRKADASHRDNLASAAEQQELFRTLSSLRFQSLATELADQLVDGEPCQVCGSTDHPAPADNSDAHVSRDDVEAAQEAFNNARTAAEESALALQAAKTSHAGFAKQLGDTTRSSLEADAERVRKQLDTAKQACLDVTALEASIAQLTAREAAAHEELASNKTAIAKQVATIEHLAKQIADDEKAVAVARAESASVAEKLTQLNVERRDTRAEREQVQSISAHIETVVGSQAQLSEALTNADMTLDEVLLAVKTDDEYAAAKAAVTSFDNEHSKIEGALENPDIIAAASQESRDLEPLEFAVHKARTTRQEADQRAVLATDSAKRATRDQQAVERAFASWAKEITDAGPIVRLAQLANADAASLSKVSLPNWVLLKRFEIVLSRANEYLLEFSRGRYELRRAHESSREKRTGLGLEVIDHVGGPNGDEIRQPGTLSGGETFFTSLSLALALAEVVQEENGGVRIETLLIDEGFGTLSHDVLDVVMDTLTSLAARGRRVGVISHVEELKSVIHNRVSIKPAPRGGSSITVVS